MHCMFETAVFGWVLSCLIPSPTLAVGIAHGPWPLCVSNSVHIGASGCRACVRLLCLSTLHCITFTTLTVKVILYIRAHGRANVADETQRDGRSRVWARRGEGDNDSKWIITPNVGAPKPARHEKNGGCIQSAPNSLQKQIQLQPAT